MELLRYGPIGRKKPGLREADGAIRRLSGLVPDTAGATLTHEAITEPAAIDPKRLPLVDGTPRHSACVGDVGKFILTGTPPGVGLGQKPPKHFSVGHVMQLRIKGLGKQTRRVVESRA